MIKKYYLSAKAYLVRSLFPEVTTIQDIAKRLKIGYGSAYKVINKQRFGKGVAKQIMNAFPGEPPKRLFSFWYTKYNPWWGSQNDLRPDQPQSQGKRHMRSKSEFMPRRGSTNTPAPRRKPSQSMPVALRNHQTVAPLPERHSHQHPPQDKSRSKSGRDRRTQGRRR